jgi:hypothetical protein
VELVELEPRVPLVIEVRLGEALGLAVATQAGGAAPLAELAGMGIGVAPAAIARRRAQRPPAAVGLGLALMAVDAGDPGVGALERVVRPQLVRLGRPADVGKARRPVASQAAPSTGDHSRLVPTVELAVVHVGVTVGARGRRRDEALQPAVLEVAAVAPDGLVGARQRETGAGVLGEVEDAGDEVRRLVAGGAPALRFAGVELALVYVVVAVDAGGGRRDEAAPVPLLDVALVAPDGLVSALE